LFILGDFTSPKINGVFKHKSEIRPSLTATEKTNGSEAIKNFPLGNTPEHFQPHNKFYKNAIRGISHCQRNRKGLGQG
jgi:hypothetical protein